MKSYGIMRSLHEKGFHTIVASEFPTIPHFASRYCSEQASVPTPQTNLLEYRDALLEIAARPDVTTIYPVREVDTYLFAKYPDMFAEHVSVVAPSLESLRIAHDRLRLAEEAEAIGVPFARTRLLSDVDEWDTNVVVKSRYNLLTSDYLDSVPETRAEEVKGVISLRAGEAPDTEAVREQMTHEPIVQDFIPQEKKILYTALWVDGEPVATYQHEQLRQNSWVGGGGIYRVSTYSKEVDDLAFQLLSHLEWHGYACIEYVRDRDTGEWKFLEINPRVWQSMPEAVRAGVDFPYYYWLASQGRADEIESSYESGIKCHNAYGEVVYLRSILRDDSPFMERPSFARAALDIVTSSILHPQFEYIRLDDPGLFLSSVRQTLKRGVRDSREFASSETYGRRDADTSADVEPSDADSSTRLEVVDQ